MSKTYQATGIIVKGMPFGETDRLVTILSPEFGLIRAIAPGARKHKSSLRGRSQLFVVNQYLILKGRSLDKITQAETHESYPGLSQDLGKLAGAQYLAELVLCCGLSEQPQSELYEIFNEHLRRLAMLTNPSQQLYAYLAQAVYHLLAVSGIAPEVHRCCLRQTALLPDYREPRWRVGFSFEAGGAVNLARPHDSQPTEELTEKKTLAAILPPINTKLGAVELSLLQHLGEQSLPQTAEILPPLEDQALTIAWSKTERVLRDYAEYHFGRSFRAAALVDSFAPLDF